MGTEGCLLGTAPAPDVLEAAQDTLGESLEQRKTRWQICRVRVFTGMGNTF